MQWCDFGSILRDGSNRAGGCVRTADCNGVAVAEWISFRLLDKDYDFVWVELNVGP